LLTLASSPQGLADVEYNAKEKFFYFHIDVDSYDVVRTFSLSCCSSGACAHL
jgi:hypothetical protein